MNLDQIPLLALIKGKLGYDNQRQRVISANVSNTDTPDFSPVDLKPFTAAKALGRGGGTLAMTAPTSAAPTGAAQIMLPTNKNVATWTTESAPDSETTIDGNGVVLEDQMMKMTESRMDFDAAVTLYQQSLGLLRMAARRPGG
jgi:flagellar basal-body rod protein FlgB